MTSAIQWLVTPAVAASSTVDLVRIVLALTFPLTTYALLGRPKVDSVRWFDVLGVVGVLVLPTTVILALEGVLSTQLTAAILGVTFGHVVTFIDTD